MLNPFLSGARWAEPKATEQNLAYLVKRGSFKVPFMSIAESTTWYESSWLVGWLVGCLGVGVVTSPPSKRGTSPICLIMKLNLNIMSMN